MENLIDALYGPLVYMLYCTYYNFNYRYNMELTQIKLKNILNYNKTTGLFIWKKRLSNRVKINTIAGCVNKTLGYRVITLYGIHYYAHRLIWLYEKGIWPIHQIDHIDGNRANNTFTNLRDITLNENRKNQRLHKKTPIKIHGVNWMKTKHKWRARIAKQHLLLTNDFFEACCARKSAEHKLNYHANHGH